MSQFRTFPILAAIGLLVSSGCSQPPSSSSSFSLTHVTIIDVSGGPSLTDMTVTVTGTRITSITPSSSSASPGGTIFDATGKFVIPGLWDMHVHWADEEYLGLFTVNGITGFRMMNGFPIHLDWRNRIESGTSTGPRMRIAGPFVDGAKPTYPTLSIAVATADDARAAVRTTKQAGYDFVKPYSGLAPDAFLALADECRKQGIPFAGHVPDGVAATDFAGHGGISEEHLRRVDLACSSLIEDPKNPPDALAVASAYDPAKAATVFTTLKQDNTWQCPTLVVSRKQLVANPGLTSDPRLDYLPPSIVAYYRSLPAAPRRPPADGMTIVNNERTIVEAMQHAGVGLLAGTDTPTYGVFPGSGLHQELALLVDAGLTTTEALQAATLNPARSLGMEVDLGTVQAGKLADLVLLDDSPLDDIANLDKIRAVVQNGKLQSRADLDAMLADLKAKAARGDDSHPWPAMN